MEQLAIDVLLSKGTDRAQGLAKELERGRARRVNGDPSIPVGRRIGCAGPFTCGYPAPSSVSIGATWVCPYCRTRYRKTRPKPVRWWRSWYAPYGRWVIALNQWAQASE